MYRVLRAVRRWPVIVAITVVVLAGGGVAFAMTRSSGSSSSSTQVVAAKMATINQTVYASGTIAAAKQADLDFGASGRVTSVRVAAGDKVRKGETLATVGRAALTAAYDAAKATVSSAADSVSEDASGSGTQLTAAKSALVAAKSQLKTARTALANARLKATMAGTVTSVDLTKGEVVAGSTSAAASSGSADPDASDSSSSDASSSSSSAVVIDSTRTYVVDATVDDTEVKSVKKGQAVAVTPDGATSSVVGTVTSVSSIPSTSSDVVTFPVVVKVSGHPSGVYAGASATLVITTKHVSNVLEIPTLAITYSGSTASVVVKSNGSTSKRTITVGVSYGLETQVLSGLKSGEDVVVTIPTFGGHGSPTGGTRSGFGGGFGGFSGGTGGFSGGGGFPGSGSTNGGTTTTGGGLSGGQG